MKNLYLIRGLPGSGKTTFAANLSWALNSTWWEADQFFVTEEEGYKWDASKIEEAHRWCKSMCERGMVAGEDHVVVSNTFTTEKEMQPYLDMAEKYGYRATTLIVENRHGGKNIHDVPEATIQKMRNRFSVKL